MEMASQQQAKGAARIWINSSNYSVVPRQVVLRGCCTLSADSSDWRCSVKVDKSDEKVIHTWPRGEVMDCSTGRRKQHCARVRVTFLLTTRTLHALVNTTFIVISVANFRIAGLWKH